MEEAFQKAHTVYFARTPISAKIKTLIETKPDYLLNLELEDIVHPFSFD